MTAPSGRLALAAGSVLDVTADSIVRLAADAGFDAVGLRVSDHHALEPRRRRHLAQLAADLGVRVHDVEVHRVGSGTDVGPLLDAAVDLGARYVLVVSDLVDVSATSDAVAAVVERALAAGVDVGLEYMAWTTPSTPTGAIDMAEATGARVVLDLLHHHRVGAGVPELEAVVASDRLGWVQLADAPDASPPDLLHEARHGRLLPGIGQLPVTEMLAVLPNDVTVSVEVQSDPLAARWSPAERVALLASAARSVVDRPPQPPSTTG